MTGLLLAAFLAARRWLTRDSLGWLLATMALWALGLASKEMAIVFPLLLWLYVRTVSPPALRVDHPNGLILLTIMAGVLALARTVVLFGPEGTGPVDLRPDLALTQIDVLRRYLVLLVAPHGQTVFHAILPFTGILDGRLWLGVAVLAGLMGWMALVHRRVPAASFGMAWFLLASA
jgi:hypothetical protein